MTLPNIEAYDDSMLEEPRLAAVNLQERRQRLAQVPAQIPEQARRYVEYDGTLADITAALDETPQL